MTRADQRADALRLANSTRRELGQLRRDIHAGRVDIAKLLYDPPAYIWHLSVFEVLMLFRRDRRAAAWKREVGAAAVSSQVNLLVPIADASDRTLNWVLRHGAWNVRKGARTGVAA